MNVLKQVLKGKEDNHLLPFFWQHGEEEKTLREYMRVIRNANIGAVCIESRPHPDFCGPGWWHDMDIILDEAQKLGMKVWILDDSHFPTGYANGALHEGAEELCRESMDVQYIEVPENTEGITIDLAAYKSAAPWQPSFIEGFVIKDDYPNMRTFESPDILSAVTAIRKGGETLSDLIDLLPEKKKGAETVTFQKPSEGAWRIAICHRTHNRGPHRDYINMLRKDAVRVLIDTVYETHYAHYGEYFGTVIAGFFSDEPEIGNGHLYEYGKKVGEGSDQAWSAEVEAALREKWGGNYAAFVPLIWNQDFDGDLQARVRAEYMDVVTRLVEKDFSFQIGDWCRSHGVEYIGHLVEDNHQHTRTGSSLGHYFRGLAGQDMAGIDDIGGQLLPQGEAAGDPGPLGMGRDGEFWHYTLGKLGGSLAALDPLKRGRTMCELFGNYGWAEGVQLEKYIADHLLTKGVNYFVPHAFSAAPFPDPDCPPHFYAHGNNPQYRHFACLMRYMNRAATLLSGGKPVIPCAVLYNAESDWAGNTMYLQKIGKALYDRQIDYLFVPNDAFSEEKYAAEISENLTVNGQVFKALLVPEVEYIPRSAAAAAAEMAEKGGLVLFANALPAATVEGGHKDPLLMRLGASGARAIPVEELPEVLLAEGLTDASVEPADDRIRIYHYRNDTDLYMIINEGTKQWNGTVTVPGEHRVGLYDAWENVLTDAEAAVSAGKTSFALSLDPRKSTFAALDPTETEMERRPEVPHGEMDWSGGWMRSICRAAAYPAFEKEKEVSVPDKLEEEEPEFSGFVRYEKKLLWTEADGRTVLRITDAREGIEVFVNGRSLGIQIVPDYVYDLTPVLRPGENAVRIEVATTLEREAKNFPNPMAELGIPQPEITARSGICGKVVLHKN